jgi:RNA polymerase-binding transcription factor DksA
MATKKKTPAKKAPAKKAPAKKAPVKKAPAKKAPAKKAPAKKAPAKKAPAKKAPAKKAPVKKAPAKKAPVKKAPAKKVVAKKVVAKKAPAKKVVAKKAPVKKAPAKKVVAKKIVAKAAPAKKIVEKKAPAPKVEPVKKAAAEKVVASGKANAPVVPTPPPMPPRISLKKPEPPKRHVIVKGPSQDGVSSTKDFDLKFLFAQRELLQQEREKLAGQATRLENEANALIADAEMGDVQFDDEGGEGDTMVVERDQDLVLSAAARQTVEHIDAALQRIKNGEYGYSSVSGSPIPKERLKAIPWATELVTERAGGLGRR